jgi:hypothetical protein
MQDKYLLFLYRKIPQQFLTEMDGGVGYGNVGPGIERKADLPQTLQGMADFLPRFSLEDGPFGDAVF